MSRREAMAWMLHISEERKTENLSDYYLMQIAAEIRRLYHAYLKIRKPVSIKDFFIKFEKKKKLTPEEDFEERKKQSQLMRSVWRKRLGR